VIPQFGQNGLLPPGTHWATWQEIIDRFGGTPHRQALLSGLRGALSALKKAGCTRVYIDGSFVTAKQIPADYDACWDAIGIKRGLLDPVFLDFRNRRAAQKVKYLGEFFPARWTESGSGKTWLEFFRVDRVTGDQKGIVAIDLGREAI